MRKSLLYFLLTTLSYTILAQSTIVDIDFTDKFTGLNGIDGSNYEIGSRDLLFIIDNPNPFGTFNGSLTWSGSVPMDTDSIDVSFDIEEDGFWGVEHFLTGDILNGKYRKSPLLSYEGREIAALISGDFTYEGSYERISGSGDFMTIRKNNTDDFDNINIIRFYW